MATTIIRFGLAALVATSLVAAPRGSQAAEPIVSTDLLRLRTVTAIDVAADGTRAVLAVRSIAAEPAPPSPESGPQARKRDQDVPADPGYSYRSHVYLLDLSDGGVVPQQLTFGDRNDRSPRLSPDGRKIAFVRGAREPDDRGQVWVMSLEGGEALQITDLEHGAWAPRWSPDGNRLLVSSSVPIDDLEGLPPWPQERPDRSWGDTEAAADGTARPDGTRSEIRAWLAGNAARLDPSVITRLDYQGERELRGLMRFTHLFIVDPDDPQSAPRQLTHGFFDHADAAFMPDGRSVVYAAKKPMNEHPDRVRRSDLWRVNVDGTGDRALLSLEGWTLSEPQPGPDGSVISFVGWRIDEPAFRLRRLGLVAAPAPGGEPAQAEQVVWLTDGSNFDAEVFAYEWRATRPALVFNSAIRGGFPLLTISPGLLEPAPLVTEQEGELVGVHVFDVGGGAIVYATTSPRRPCAVRVRDARGDRLAWDLNTWVADKALSLPVEGTVSRPDGTQVQYWLMEPTNRQAKQTYPLVVEIHGGPSVMWGPGELTMWHEFQLLCSWGFGVVYANPRGSGGYGYAFRRANFQDWGEGPAGDVLAVVDQMILNDWVDADRLVVTGGSYAGYLTAWIVAHDHRFKAAVAQRGVYELATFFGEGNAWRLVEWSMGGYPFDARYREVLRRNSPFTYVNRIRTPLLIIHADEDLRAGVQQSAMLYRALKALGRPVEYVRYPRAGHDLSRTGEPLQRMDRLHRIIEFFERYVENPRPAPVVGGGSAPD
ncbi:MAG: prolyl oligopeptidase family serine peptidase [Planctomycetota bacterium]|jgi:dipeptidyl aminopeptidase/acylaminoacyl peptidase